MEFEVRGLDTWAQLTWTELCMYRSVTVPICASSSGPVSHFRRRPGSCLGSGHAGSQAAGSQGRLAGGLPRGHQALFAFVLVEVGAQAAAQGRASTEAEAEAAEPPGKPSAQTQLRPRASLW